MSNDRDKRYPTTCPYCGKEIHVQRSLGMMIGFTPQGFGTCPHCKKMSQINYDCEKETILAIMNDFTETLNQRALENNHSPEETS